MAGGGDLIGCGRDTQNTLKTLVQAFISCRLDYCNLLMSGMADSLMRKVQSVQNVAARLVSGASRRDHITPVMHELHWLLVCQQIHFKLGCLMHKSLSGQAPSTWRMTCSLLLTVTDVYCDLPVTEPVSFHGHNSFGDRPFSAAGPRVWNALP